MIFICAEVIWQVAVKKKPPLASSHLQVGSPRHTEHEVGRQKLFAYFFDSSRKEVSG